MGMGDRADYREPEAGPAGGAVAGRVGAVEAVEDQLALIGGNAGTVVRHDETHTIALDRGDIEADEPVRRGGVLDRVAGEVTQRLGESVGVGTEGAGGDWGELEAALGGEAHAVPEIRDEWAQVDRLDVQELSLFGLREQQQVVDQAGDSRYLGLHE